MTALPICPHCQGTGYQPHLPEPVLGLDGVCFGLIEGVILRTLVEAGKEYRTCQSLALACYGFDFDDHRHPRTIRVHIANINRKLIAAKSSKRVQGVWRFGYRLIDKKETE